MTFLTLPLSVLEDVLDLLAQGRIDEALSLLAKHGYTLSATELQVAWGELEATVLRARLDSLLASQAPTPTPRPRPKH